MHIRPLQLQPNPDVSTSIFQYWVAPYIGNIALAQLPEQYRALYQHTRAQKCCFVIGNLFVPAPLRSQSVDLGGIYL